MRPKKKLRKRWRPPPLSLPQILAWADTHHACTGQWPNYRSGPIRDAPLGENWRKVDSALRYGLRGLRGGSTLARLLVRERGMRDRLHLPALTGRLILRWADAHYHRTGTWPLKDSGPIPEAPGENWKKIDAALQDGRRTLPGGDSLAQLLARHRGVRNRARLPRLAVAQILTWADRHFRRTGAWPRHSSGPIGSASGETWLAVETALRRGQRGLPGGSSLAGLLAAERGARNKGRLPPLAERQILAWADAHHRRTKAWPTAASGPVLEAQGETWGGVAHALKEGLRGLSGDSSLARLLAGERDLRNRAQLPPLTVRQILAWARTHYRCGGRWPTSRSGPISGVPGETWQAVEMALSRGGRGLPGGYSLARLLRRDKRRRDPRNRA